MIAIKMAVTHVQTKSTEKDRSITDKLHIFSDSQCAIGHLVLGWEPKSHKATIQEVKEDIKNLEQAGVKVEISLTPGHSDIKGNELADRLAKEQLKKQKK